MQLDNPLHNLEIFQCAFEKATEKLHKHVQATTRHQVLKEIRILDPSKVCVFSHNLQDYTTIPGWSEVSPSEFDLYIQRLANLAPTAVSVAGGLWSSDSDVDFFWSSVVERLPKLSLIARTYINAVCNK